MEFPAESVLFAIVVGLLVVPIQMTLVPLLRAFNGMGLTGSFLGIWLAHTGFGLPLTIYLLYNYISQLPRDLFESAFIDGASHFTAFIRLVLPLSMPTLAAFAIFQFFWVWNDLLVALVFLDTDSQVAILTARLDELVGNRGQDWHFLTAGAFVTMVVPVVVFLGLQRHFVRGLLAGSVKDEPAAMRAGSHIAGVGAAAADADSVVIGTISAGKEQGRLVEAALASGQPTVTVALRTPFDLAVYPSALTHLCTYSLPAPSMESLADVIFGKAEARGSLPANIPGLHLRAHRWRS